jgi:hypothetical protein
MKQIKNCFFSLLPLAICLFVFQAQAQNATVTGKVLEIETFKPIEGVTVSVKNGTQKATTNAVGVFTIAAAKGSSLVVSVIGYQEKQVVVSASSLTIELTPSTAVLGDVVVTALGIKRNEKSLGYAAQSVSENAVKDAKTNQQYQKHCRCQALYLSVKYRAYKIKSRYKPLLNHLKLQQFQCC